jgi:hypothetical protein
MGSLLFARLQEEKELLEIEKEKSELLLLNIFPGTIAERLKAVEKNIDNGHHVVSVMFGHLCGFTDLSRKTSPADLVNMLNEIFTVFDNIVKDQCVEKIITIGDCYMLVGGLPDYRDDHAHAVVDSSLEMIQALDRINKKGAPTSPCASAFTTDRSLPASSARSYSPTTSGVIPWMSQAAWNHPECRVKSTSPSRPKPNLTPSSTSKNATWSTARASGR